MKYSTEVADGHVHRDGPLQATGLICRSFLRQDQEVQRQMKQTYPRYGSLIYFKV